ncbi:MAG: hypothetical protein AAFN77_15905 [Planctomycetota bacterium]
MLYQTLKVTVVAVALACCSSTMAQDCGCNTTYAGGMYAGGGLFSGSGCGGAAQDNCGRGISHVQAAGLWSNYCNEQCGYAGGNGGCGSSGCGGGCRLGGKLKGLFAGGGAGAGSCGCGFNQGCFGYPSGGCGCGGAVMAGGGFAGKMRGGCKLGGKLKGMFAGGGCGSSACGSDPCGGGLGFGNRGCGCKLGGKLKGLFSGGGLFGSSRNACGVSGAYFGEAVGYEYGTAGMQSCVAGCSNGQATMMNNGSMQMENVGSSVIGNGETSDDAPTIQGEATPLDSKKENVDPSFGELPADDNQILPMPNVDGN